MVQLMFNQAIILEGEGPQGLFRVLTPSRQGDHLWMWRIPIKGAGDESDGSQTSGELAEPTGEHAEAGREDRRLICVSLDEMEEAMAQPGSKVIEVAVPGRCFRTDLKLAADDESEPASDGQDRQSAGENEDEVVRLFRRRQLAAKPMLSQELIRQSLDERGNIGLVIRAAVAAANCHRNFAYKVWNLLVCYGFVLDSLVPATDARGAPGVARPLKDGRKKAGRKTNKERLGIPDENPQHGWTEEARNRALKLIKQFKAPGKPFTRVAQEVIARGFVTKFELVDGVMLPVPPDRGTYPNLNQLRYLERTGFSGEDRRKGSTSQGHYARNRRGLRGRSFDNVPGPGHTYAIDSTVGDVYLVSSVNRSWVVGRPIVYLIVDVYSTAIVGFYVALEGPTWACARLALYATFADKAHVATMTGSGDSLGLWPPPAIPLTLLGDRGEYITKAAKLELQPLGFSISINEARRPDLKGLVEVSHRILRDEQFTFIPGAFNKRREEQELKPEYKLSTLTVQEFARDLSLTIDNYNNNADRRYRMTTAMMATGTEPTPAGIWRFGHEAGLGYGKHVSSAILMKHLLLPQEITVRRGGIFMHQLEYRSEEALKLGWSEEARNVQTKTLRAYCFPHNLSHIWTPLEDGSMMRLQLAENARATPITTLEEWLDALMDDSVKNAERQHKRLSAAVTTLAKRRANVQAAEVATAADRTGPKLPALNVLEARALERSLGAQIQACGDGGGTDAPGPAVDGAPTPDHDPGSSPSDPAAAGASRTPSAERYASAMRRLLEDLDDA